MASDLGDVLVLGLGRSGGSAARWCASHLGGGKGDGFSVSSLTVYAGPSNDASLEAGAGLEAMGANVVFDSEQVEGSYDLAIKSPGISVHSDFSRNAERASGELICEPELAYRISPERWVGITGTNGKTTTTMLVAELMHAAGMPARTCGNIGLPCIEAAADRSEGEYLVAELSSFQLASMGSFAPDAAILLNITPNHVEWHGTLEHYTASKLRIFQSQTPEQFAIVDCTAQNTRAIAVDLMRRGHSVICLGGPEGFGQDYLPLDEFGGDIERFSIECEVEHSGSAYVSGGRICVDVDGEVHELAMASDLQILGEHNLQNALAAAAAAVVCGVPDGAIARGLVAFEPVEHRIEYCGSAGGVRFYNDSKSTSTDATIKALAVFDPGSAVLLLGGHDKQTDLADLVADCLSRCKAVVCYGEAGPRFHAAFEQAMASSASPCRLLSAEHMRDAFDLAVETASDGDVVLLSPACSSFDEFTCFEERGEAFRSLVANLPGFVGK